MRSPLSRGSIHHSLFLLLVLCGFPCLGQGNLTSLIPQPDVPVLPSLTTISRSKNDVENFRWFHLAFASLRVREATKGPSDWKIDVEGFSNSSHSAELNYLAVANGGQPTQRYIDPTKAQFTWTGELEVPAKQPHRVVGIPPDISKTEQLSNPAIMQPPLQQPVLYEAKDDYSYTVRATDDKVVMLHVVAKFMQRVPDAANGGKLKIQLQLRNTQTKAWKPTTPGTDFNCYQCTIVYTLSVALNRDDPKHSRYFETKDNGEIVLPWRVVLMNENGQKQYGVKVR